MLKLFLSGLLIACGLLAQNPNTAAFPSSTATDQTLFVASNNATTTISFPLTSGATTLNVGSTALFIVPTLVSVDSEVIAVCAKPTSTTFTVCSSGRGYDGTTAAAHSAGAQLAGNVTRWFHNQVAAEIKAIESNAIASVSNDTNVTGSLGGGVFTLGWTSTLAAARLNSNVVQAVVNDTNITGSISAQTLTLGFTGTLAKARLLGTVVYNDQANTYGAFYQDFHLASLRWPEATVSGLPSAAASTGKSYIITDGTSASDCTVGSGSTAVICRSNGATWVSLGGSGGGSGATAVYQLTDFLLAKNSASQWGINTSCSSSAPCAFRVGTTTYKFTATGTVTTSGSTATGTVNFCVNLSNGHLTATHNTAATLTGSGVDILASTVGCPTNYAPLWAATMTSNVPDAIAESMDQRAVFSAKPSPASGTGIVITSGAQDTIAVDTTTVVRKFFGAGTPSNPSGSSQRGDLYYNTSASPIDVYECENASGCTISGDWNKINGGSGSGNPTTYLSLGIQGTSCPGADAVLTGGTYTFPAGASISAGDTIIIAATVKHLGSTAGGSHFGITLATKDTADQLGSGFVRDFVTGTNYITYTATVYVISGSEFTATTETSWNGGNNSSLFDFTGLTISGTPTITVHGKDCTAGDTLNIQGFTVTLLKAVSL